MSQNPRESISNVWIAARCRTPPRASSCSTSRCGARRRDERRDCRARNRSRSGRSPRRGTPLGARDDVRHRDSRHPRRRCRSRSPCTSMCKVSTRAGRRARPRRRALRSSARVVTDPDRPDPGLAPGSASDPVRPRSRRCPFGPARAALRPHFEARADRAVPHEPDHLPVVRVLDLRRGSPGARCASCDVFDAAELPVVAHDRPRQQV